VDTGRTEPERDRPRRAEPLWAWAVVGWLAVQTVLARLDVLAPGPAARDVAAPSASLAEMAPRDLRRLPGIGERRAVDVARARWEFDGGSGPVPAPQRDPLRLHDVRGIGPVTAERARLWLAEHGAPDDGLVIAPLRARGTPLPGPGGSPR